jgi:SAM-dependent methyltransferase
MTTADVLSTPPATDPPDPPAPIDADALEAYTGLAGLHLTAATTALLVGLGDRLGLWKALDGAGPVTSQQLAARTGYDERYLREWLAAQATSGFVTHDPSATTFVLSTEGALVLAREDSPALMAGGFQGLTELAAIVPGLADAFRTGAGIAWNDRDTAISEVQERFSRPLLGQFLVDVWLAAVPGLTDRLATGTIVADVGCGYGTSTILLAQAFPASTFRGFDFHDHSIARARRAAADAGVADRVTFEVADAASFPGDDYGLVLFADSLHDMGDPVAAARHARSVLGDGGVVVTLDPVAGDSLGENLANPMAAMFYGISTFLCTPTAVAQHGDHALGAMGGEAALRQILVDAGLERVERVAPDAPFNMVITGRR